MAIGEWCPVPKPEHKRGSKTAKQRGEITPEVYQAAWERSSGRCERCRKSLHVLIAQTGGRTDRMEAAHAQRRHNYGQEGVQEWDVLILCGPQVNSGTCHHWIDSTREGMDWAIARSEELRIRLRSAPDPIVVAPGQILIGGQGMGEIRIIHADDGRINIEEV